VALILNWLLAGLMSRGNPAELEVPYTLFKEQVQAGNVARITTRGLQISGTFERAVTYPPAGQPNSRSSTSFRTQVPGFGDQGLTSELQRRGVVVTVEDPPTGQSLFLSLVLSFLPTLLFFGLMIWLVSRAARSQQGMFGLGRNRARRYSPESGETPRITFEDVAGIEEAEGELAEIVDFLKNPQKYQRLGGTIPKGVLLVGEPGTGKTLLARAVAGEANVPFFSMSGSEFVEMIVGVGASRVRDLFTQAKKEAPAIVFVDELDAIGRRRGGNVIGGNDEREQTLNQLLVEMDGFDSRQAVIVLAATNRPDVLDPALLRPGRFDRRITVQRPDRVGRRAILEVHTRGVPLAPGLNLDEIANATPGLVGADLRNLVNEAALLAARRGKDYVDREDFFDAMERIVLGAERQLLLSEEDRRRVAYHESGHAVLGLLVPEADPVHKVTIVPRGQALGVTYQMPVDDRYNYTERYLRGRIIGALGGRAAEEIVFGVKTTGAENDLQQVTEMARQMVTRWGMSPEVGLLHLTSDNEDNFLGSSGGTMSQGYSESLAQVVDRETRRIIDECYADAVNLLTQERTRLDALASALLERESLDEPEIRQVVGLAPREEQPDPAHARTFSSAV
jgi:cell division protease FtsH